MKAAFFDQDGKSQGEIDLPSELFGEKFGMAVMQEVVSAELRNRRQGTHKTKTVSEVRGGGKKPWKQKGTGHARQGSTRSTQFRGGGIVFGPVPRDYHVSIPRKKRAAGLRSILSFKATKGAIVVLKQPVFEDFSTKKMNGILKAMGVLNASGKKTVTFIAKGADDKLIASCLNLPNVNLIAADRPTAPELFYADTVVISETAIDELANRYSKKKVGSAV